MKRFTATEKWQKDWFQSLTPGQKCLWNYLCDNCDAAGVWEPNWRLASFVINETFTAASLAVFGARVRALPGGKIWLTGFCEFQYSHLSRECRAHTHIIRSLEKHRLLAEVEHLLAGPEPTEPLWHRVADRDKEKEKEKEKERDTDQDKDPDQDREPERIPPPALDLAALGGRVGAIMRRRPGSRWSERERSAVAALFPLDANDLLLMERYYAADVPAAEDIRRRDLLTLLNHWPGELDRARAFWRKRGWRLPAGAGDPGPGNGPAAGTGGEALPEGFAAWKAQAPEYAAAAWRDWAAVPAFAREEFLRWRKSRGRAGDEAAKKKAVQ